MCMFESVVEGQESIESYQPHEIPPVSSSRALSLFDVPTNQSFPVGGIDRPRDGGGSN